MMQPTLIEFANAKRFWSSPYKCPQCNGETLRDEWPPNYGGGSFGVLSQSGSTIKHVCLNCMISFTVAEFSYSGPAPLTIPPDAEPFVTKSGVTRGIEEASGFHIMDITPLVERDGKLLTPHDVRNYEYFDKHGVWPQEVYY